MALAWHFSCSRLPHEPLTCLTQRPASVYNLSTDEVLVSGTNRLGNRSVVRGHTLMVILLMSRLVAGEAAAVSRRAGDAAPGFTKCRGTTRRVAS